MVFQCYEEARQQLIREFIFISINFLTSTDIFSLQQTTTFLCAGNNQQFNDGEFSYTLGFQWVLVLTMWTSIIDTTS